MALLKSIVIVVAVLLSSPAGSQHIEPPTIGDARAATERNAFQKAKCVYDAMTIAGNALTVPVKDQAKPEMRDRIAKELEAFDKLSRDGVKACLSEQEVYDLGRYSYMEDIVFAEGNSCPIEKAPAARFQRTSNNNDGDIVNGAVRWERIPINAPLEAHPFFKGQSDARKSFGTARRQICQAIAGEYGPHGSRFPGLVRMKR
jgi:hypothetical protein